MGSEAFNYSRMVEDALRGVVRAALAQAEASGLPGNHHFYISFRTGAPGVEVPAYLRSRYPDEMTIVLQHQYWGLEVDDVGFYVTLSFNRVQERMRIPYAAVASFADPSVQFGLQFRDEAAGTAIGKDGGSVPALAPRTALPSAPKPAASPGKAADAADSEAGERADDRKSGEVVTLDAFRKK
jgi:hypothetical protein